MRSFVLRLGSSLLIGSVLLLLVYALLLSAAPARSTRARVLDSVPTQTITDTRWIELIRSGIPGPQSHRSTSALPTINLHLTDGLVAGRVPLAASVRISVTRAGNLVVQTTATPFPDGSGGYLYVTSFVWYSDYPLMSPGDVVWVMQAGASVSLTVPTLTAWANASADTVYGVAPISQSVTAYLYPFAAPETVYTHTVSTDGEGHYQAVFSPTLDVLPRDNGYVAYAVAPDRLVYLRFAAPLLRVQVNGDEITGVAVPRSLVVLTLTQADGTPLREWATYSYGDGAFTAYPQRLQAGTHITASSAGQTFSMTVMSITVKADLNSGVVSGTALPHQPIEVRRFTGPAYQWSTIWSDTPIEKINVTASATGEYTAGLTLARPNYGLALVTAADGNQTYAVWAVPYITARLGTSYSVSGQVAGPFAPITLTLQGPSGYNKDVRLLTADRNGAFADYASSSVVLDTGDVIIVATPGGVQTALTLPLLTGDIDPISDTVAGQAPPNTRLTLHLQYPSPIYPTPSHVPTAAISQPSGGGYYSLNYTANVTATAQGDYFLDLHGVVDLDQYATGEMLMTTAAGHAVSRAFGVSAFSTGVCDPQLQTIYVGSNQVDFRPFYQCPDYVSFYLRLRSSHGQLKAALSGMLSPYQPLYPANFSVTYQPVPIEPGDVVELESYSSPVYILPSPTPFPQSTRTPTPTPTPWVGSTNRPASNQFIAVTVPTLTVQLDPAASTLTGQAPANTIVSLQLSRDNWTQRTMIATVDAQGTYFANLAGVYTLRAGDTAKVSYASQLGPIFQAQAILPVLRARPYEWLVTGWLPPFTAYTLTLQTTRPMTVVMYGMVDSTGQLARWLAPIEPGDSVVLTTTQTMRRLTMPQLTARINRDTAMLEGQAPPNSRLLIEPLLMTSFFNSQEVTATASGTYSASFPVAVPVTNLSGRLTYFDTDGDQAQVEFATPHWEVTLEQTCVHGVADMSNTPLTLTLRNSSGGFKSAFSLTPSNTSYSACFTATVQSQDQLVLSTPATAQAFTMPRLTAKHDYGQQVLTGLAPANRALLTTFFNYASPYNAFSRSTWTDAAGQYGVDTSDLALRVKQTGSVVFTDDQGNKTTQNFTITGYQAFLPVIRRQ